MLDTLRQAGWRVIGTERTPEMLAYARQELGLPVFVGGMEALSPEPLFDLIIIFQVLEHLADPATTLKQCAQLLKPEGRLVIGVPNFGSWQARFAGPLWFHLDVPRHLFHFSPESLAAALSEAGLGVGEVRFVSFEHDPYGWAQSILNRMGLRHNGLTRMLMRMDSPSVSGFLQFVVGGFLVVLGLPLAFISWVGRRGALMQVKAVRQSKPA
jgi:SAM-dependent methyltransferase